MQMAKLSHCNSKIPVGKGKKIMSKSTMFYCSIEENLIHLFWKQSSSSFFGVLTFVLIGYKKLINCSKLQHSEMIENSVTDYSLLQV